MGKLIDYSVFQHARERRLARAARGAWDMIAPGLAKEKDEAPTWWCGPDCKAHAHLKKTIPVTEP